MDVKDLRGMEKVINATPIVLRYVNAVHERENMTSAYQSEAKEVYHCQWKVLVM